MAHIRQLTGDQKATIWAACISAVAASLGAAVGLAGAVGAQHVSSDEARRVTHAGAVTSACSSAVEAVTSYMSLINQIYFMNAYSIQKKSVVRDLLNAADAESLPVVYAKVTSAQLVTVDDISGAATDLHNAVSRLSSEAQDDLYRSQDPIPRGQFDMSSFKQHFEGINGAMTAFTSACRSDSGMAS